MKNNFLPLKVLRVDSAMFGLLMVITLFLQSCKTTSTISKVSEDGESIELLSTADPRSPSYRDSKDTQKLALQRKFKKALEKSPTDVTALLSLSQISLAENDLEKAEDFAKRALRFDRKNSEARKVLAATNLRNGRVDLAEIILNSLKNSQQKDSATLNMRALIAHARGQNQDALNLWKDSIKKDQNNLAPRLNLGVMYLKYRQLNEASIQFERVLKIASENTDAQLHLAIVKGIRGQNKEAEKVYNEILTEDKSNPLALFNLAIAENRMGQHDDAIANLKTYLKSKTSLNRNNDEVFALIDEIQNDKLAKGQVSNEEEAQSLAAKLKDAEDRSKDPSKPKEAPTREALNEATQSEKSPAEPENADIKALEKELQK